MVYECHGHIILDGISYSDAIARHKGGVDKGFVRRNLEIYAEHGVCFFRDGGDKHGASAYAATIAEDYGIDYRTPVFIIHRKGFYGGMFGRAYEGLSEYRGLIDKAKRLGADFIKLTASGMLDFENEGLVTGRTVPDEELREIIKIAHGEGFAVMVHVNDAENIIRAAIAGADSIEHGFYMNDAALHVLKQTDAVWVPTSVAVSNLIGKGLFNDDLLIGIVEGHKNALSKARDMEILIACGSDCGSACVQPGIGTLEELSFLEALGINPDAGNRKIEEVFKRI